MATRRVGCEELPPHRSLTDRGDNPPLARYRIAAQAAGIFVCLVGGTVLIGWTFDLAVLKGVVPGFVTMKVNTAGCFVACGVSLLLLGRGHVAVSRRSLAPSRISKSACGRIVAGFAVLVACLGAANLSEDLCGVNLGVDEWLVRDVLPSDSATAPGRMSPPTGLAFLLMSAALLASLSTGRRPRSWAQVPALLAGLIGLLASLGYAYGMVNPYRFGLYSGMALNTAVSFVVLAAGLLCVHANCGLMALVAGNRVGSVVARRLLPVAVGLPMLVGGLHLVAERYGLFGHPMGTAILASTLVVIFAGLIGATAATMNRQDAARQRAEESRGLFRALLDRSCDAIEVIDPHTGRYLDVNEQSCLDLGYTREEHLALTVFDIDPTVNPASFAEFHQQLGDSGFQTWNGLHRRKDGSTFPVEVGVTRVRLDRDYIVSAVRNVTERRRLMTAIDQVAEAIVITDAQGIIQYVNPAFERITGYAAGEVLGQNPRLLQSGKHDDGFYRAMWLVLTRGEVWRGRFTNKKRDGTLYEEEATISPVRDGGGRTVNYVAVKRDVTREAEMESQLRQAQKMEAVGRLAGGVAHDFNNLLTAILGHADLALLRLTPSQPALPHIEQVKQSGNRAAALTRQLLAFSRKQPLQPQVIDLNALVGNLQKMLQRLICESITLVTRLTPSAACVKADPGQIEQVVMNLVVNARDAMPDGGKLLIETAEVELDEAYARRHVEATPGRYLRLAVSDTGSGMSAEVQSRLFEPFFTTKGPERGTGLGLSTVYGIVKQSGGHVAVHSELGRGSVFHVYLPQVESAVREAAAPSACNAWPSGRETVLLVEDHEPLRRLVRTTLESCGYHVLEAGNGQQAVAVAQGHSGPIHMLLSDVVMPQMNGQVLGRLLAATRPAMKRLYMSGYTDPAILHPDQLGPGAFLQKPFTLDELARKIRQVLDT